MTDTGLSPAATATPAPAASAPPSVAPAGGSGPRIGVLLTNLGTPDATDYWTVRRFLSEFLSDKRVIDYPSWLWQPILQLFVLARRPKSSGDNYKLIWNKERDESPLLTITRAQTEGVAARARELWGERVRVDFCMRYGNPSVRSKVREMLDAGCERLLYFPLYPQYAGATVATANDQLFRALMEERRQPSCRIVPPYYARPSYIAALAGSVRARLGDARPDVLVCSYHGLNVRYVTLGDPYEVHCRETTRLLAQALEWPETQVVTTFQSRFGPEKWLQPYTVEEVARLVRYGKRNMAVIAPAFSADCVETLEEIQGEIRDAFMGAGGETFTYVPCLNDSMPHVEMMVEAIAENLQGWLG